MHRGRVVGAFMYAGVPYPGALMGA